jgi:hypothetical protein
MDRVRPTGVPDATLIFFSSSKDRVGPAFAEYCRGCGLEALIADRQLETQLYFELSGQVSALLRVRQPDGSHRRVAMEDVRGVWFRGLPDLPEGLDGEDAIYAATEFSACLAACLRATTAPCFGYPSPEAPFQSVLNFSEIHAWCRRNEVPVLPKADEEHLMPIPIRASILEPEKKGPFPGRRNTHDPKPDSMYYIRFGTRGRLLAEDGRHTQDTLARALETGHRLVEQFSVHTAIVELAATEDGRIALGGVFPSVSDWMILRDRAWYFDAVLEALGV